MNNYNTNEKLIIEIKNGNKELINELYLKNINGIRKASFEFYKKYSNTITKIGSFEYEDIFQTSNLIFIESIEKYNYNKGVKFITFMMNYINWKLFTIFFRDKKIRKCFRAEYDKALLLNSEDEFEESFTENKNNWNVPVFNEKFDVKIQVEEVLASIKNIKKRNMIEDFYIKELSIEQIKDKNNIDSVKKTRQIISRTILETKKKWKRENKNENDLCKKI